MPSASLLDFDALLAPIDGDDPAGVRMFNSPEYDEIKKSRQERSRDLLQEEEKAADWPRIINLAKEVVSRRSKDLQFTAWLTEALTKVERFAGLRDGLKLLTGLLENYWGELQEPADPGDDAAWSGAFPRPDGNDLEPRLGPVQWLLDADRGSRLPITVRDLPLVSNGEEAFSWNTWKSVNPVRPKGASEDDDAYSQRVASAEALRGRMDAAFLQSGSGPELSTLYEDAQEAQNELKRFDDELERRFGNDAPGASVLRSAIEDCLQLMRSRLPQQAGEPTSIELETQASPGQNGQAAGNGEIRSREDAFRRLRQVADYLTRHEPQNPVSFLTRKAAEWSGLPFEQLLCEIIKNQSEREHAGEILGIKLNEEASSNS